MCGTGVSGATKKGCAAEIDYEVRCVIVNDCAPVEVWPRREN